MENKNVTLQFNLNDISGCLLDVDSTSPAGNLNFVGNDYNYSFDGWYSDYYWPTAYYYQCPNPMFMDKGRTALTIVRMLIDKKILTNIKVKDFIAIMDEIIKAL